MYIYSLTGQGDPNPRYPHIPCSRRAIRSRRSRAPRASMRIATSSPEMPVRRKRCEPPVCVCLAAVRVLF